MSELVQTTTSFYREPSALTTIVKRLAPQFGSMVKVASVGCSRGQEVYSLLYLNRLARTGIHLNVDGFDINPEVLETAKSGTYRKDDMRGLYPYGDALLYKLTGPLSKFSKNFTMPDALRKNASFSYHDITKSPLPERYPVILCANVLYHLLTPERKPFLSKTLDNLAASLEDNGYLVCESGYQGKDVDQYHQALDSHPAFKNRNDIGIVFVYKDQDPKGLTLREQARVMQKVA